MNIKKIIAAALCLSVFVGKSASGYEIIGQNQTEVTLMSSATETKNVSEILPATVNSEYKQVLVDGSTTNMDEGTVYRGLGVITGNNSSRLLMDYKAKNPDAYWEIMNLAVQAGLRRRANPCQDRVRNGRKFFLGNRTLHNALGGRGG